MAKMATHSDGSFSEAKAIRILSDKLEEHGSIKTFFKENDRTPNHDGFFELVDENKMPKKQFIVQIKKVEGNANNGKLPYDIDTKFLYYVKDKVTESPALFFLVDVKSYKIYYLYLSDAKLMSLNFEGKGKVRYWFKNEDVLENTSVFYRKMLAISAERNKKFVNKTPQEIMELQDAADYINTLLNGELKNIKNSVFPNLWRFGIGYTESCDIRVEHKTESDIVESRIENANMFGLFPQIKGECSPEIGEYRNNSLFTTFDFTKKNTPMDYSMDIVHKMIRNYCTNPPLSVLPTIILKEMIIKEMTIIHSYVGTGICNTVDDAIQDFHIMLSCVTYILDERNVLEGGALQRKEIITNLLNAGQMHCIPLTNPFLWGDLSGYSDDYRNKGKVTFRADIFNYISIADAYYYSILLELRKRKEYNIEPIWTSIEETDSLVNEKKFFENLYQEVIPLYLETYNRVFDSNKYLFSRRVYFSLQNNNGLTMISRVEKTIREKPSISFVNADYLENDDNYIGLGICYSSIWGWNSAMNRRTWFYDTVRCFLYQGICDALGYKCQGLSIDGKQLKMFA